MARAPRDAGNDSLIANAGSLEVPDEKDIPNEFEFEILRLRRRVEALEGAIKDRDTRNVRAIAMIEDELQMWRTVMHDHVYETHGEIQRRIVRLESTLATLREKGSLVYPPLEIPAAWQKKKTTT